LLDSYSFTNEIVPIKVTLSINGGFPAYIFRINFGYKRTSSSAVSAAEAWLDEPEDKTIASTLLALKAWSSFGLRRMFLSLVITTHLFFPTTGNQSTSGQACLKWSWCGVNFIPAAISASPNLLLQAHRSIKSKG